VCVCVCVCLCVCVCVCARVHACVLGIFKIGSGKLFAQGWLRTTIFLIFASWEASITDVSLQLPATLVHFKDSAYNPGTMAQTYNPSYWGGWQKESPPTGPSHCRNLSPGHNSLLIRWWQHRKHCLFHIPRNGICGRLKVES
jgi:hypothetical protein